MKTRLVILVLLIIIYSFLVAIFPRAKKGVTATPSPSPVLATTSSPTSLLQASSLESSDNKYWWLKSGGKLIFEKDFMSTDGIQDTFLAVEKTKQENFRQFFYYNIQNIGEGTSGLFLLSRYQDDTTYYQIGLSTLGNTLILKKSKGKSTTLAEGKLPEQLPVDKWMGLQSEVQTLDDGKVSLKLYGDMKGDNNWTLILEALDKNAPILAEGHPAILSHFLDFQFTTYKIEQVY